MSKAARQRLPIHPEDAEPLVVRHQFAGADGVDVLRRQRHADDRELAQPAVDHRGNLIAGIQPVGGDEPFAGEHFVAPAALDPASAPQEQVVDARPAVRTGSRSAGRDAGSSSCARSSVTLATTRVSIAETPGSAAISAATRSGARFMEAKTSANRCRL